MSRLRPNAFLSGPFDPEREVLAALRTADDERIWHTLRRAPHQDALFQLLAEEAPRMAHRLRSGPCFSELLLVPVIETTPGQVVGNRAGWQAAEQCFSDAIRVWRGSAADHTIFRGVFPYEWIAAWEPSMFRQHLLAASPGAGAPRVTFMPNPLVLPDGSPRLGFVVVAVRHREGWPQLPDPDSSRDARFRQVVAHALSDAAACQAPEVLPPDQVSAALADGLCLWLAMLHETVQITGWDMAPSAAQPDAVEVDLQLARQAAGAVQFHLRKHQVAQVGVDCVAALLGALAPRTAVGAFH